MSESVHPAQQEKLVFYEVADIDDPEERARRLKILCEDNQVLQKRVELLLKLDEGGTAFMDEVVLSSAAHQPGEVDNHPSGLQSVLSGAGYEIGSELARGGMGQIHRAEDLKLERTVAVKVMHEQAALNQTSVSRFLFEAKVLAKLEHPNIVPVHDIVWEGDQPLFYSMKLVKGQTLQQIVSDLGRGDEAAIEEHSEASLLTVFRKVCDAMAFAHSRGIIHRDLKPENIMVGEFGEVLVMDWGLAKTLNSGEERGASEVAVNQRLENVESVTDSGSLNTLEGTVIGTPQYMSPEQARGEIDELDERSDIFALGGVLYAILTLRAPVEGQTVQEVLEKVKSGGITPPMALGAQSTTTNQGGEKEDVGESSAITSLPHLEKGRIPTALSSVAMKALQLDKGQRYQSVSAFSADIEAYQGGFATSAESAGLAKQISLLIKRNQGIFATGVAAWLLITVLGIWFIFNLRAKERRAFAGEQAAIVGREATERVLSSSYLNSGVHEADRGNTARAALWFAEASLIDPTGSERSELNRGRAAEFTRAANMPVRGLRGSDQKTYILAFSHDNRYLLRATNGDGYEFFDLENEFRNDELGTFSSATFVNNPPRIVLSRAPGEISFLSLGNFDEVGKFDLGSGIGEIVALGASEDSRHLFVGGREGCLFWDVDKDDIVDDKIGPYPIRSLASIAVAPGGRKVYADYGKGLVFDRDDADAGWVELGNQADVAPYAYAFPRLRYGFFPGREGQIDLFEPVTPDGFYRGAPVGHRAIADAIIVSPDGSLIAKVMRSGIIRILRTNSPPRRWIIPRNGSDIRPVISRSGTHLVAVSRRTAGQSGFATTRVYDLASTRPVSPDLHTGKTILDADFSPGRNNLVFACGHLERTRESIISPVDGGEIQFWNWMDGVQNGKPIPMPSEPRTVRFHPSGEWLAVVCAGGEVMRIEFPDGAASQLFRGDGKIPNNGGNFFPAYGGPGRLRFASGGEHLLAWDIGQSFCVWNTKKNAFQFAQKPLAHGTNSVDIRGDFLLSTGLHTHAKEGWIRRLPSGEIVPGDLTRRVSIPSGTLNREGNVLVLAGLGRNLAVHRVEPGFPLACPDLTLEEGSWSEAAFIEPRPLIMVISSAIPSVAQVFDHRTGRPYTPSFGRLYHVRPTSLVASPDGNYAAASWNGLGIIVHDFRELGKDFDGLSPDGLRLLAEINALSRVEDGALVKLSDAQWIDRWDEFRRLHPEFHSLGWPTEIRKLHHRNRMLETRGRQAV